MGLLDSLFSCLILNSFIVITLNEVLIVDGIVASLFGMHSTYNCLFENQKKKVLITFSKTMSFTLFLVIPLIQITLTLFAYGVVIVSKIYWMYAIMLGFDFIEIYLRNPDLELKSVLSGTDTIVIETKQTLLRSNFKRFIFFMKHALKTKEFIINLIITIILSYLDISTLNVVHCITIFYTCELLVFYEKFLIAFELTFGSNYKLNDRRIGILKKFNEMIWMLNYVLQAALLGKIIVRGEADIFTYVYIYTVPIIWYNA